MQQATLKALLAAAVAVACWELSAVWYLGVFHARGGFSVVQHNRNHVQQGVPILAGTGPTSACLSHTHTHAHNPASLPYPGPEPYTTLNLKPNPHPPAAPNLEPDNHTTLT